MSRAGCPRDTGTNHSPNRPRKNEFLFCYPPPMDASKWTVGAMVHRTSSGTQHIEAAVGLERLLRAVHTMSAAGGFLPRQTR